MEEQRPKTTAEMLEAEAERIAALSDKELRREFSRIGGGGTIGILLEKELAMRAASPKHHWSLSPAFIVACITMILAAIAAWPIVRDWFANTHVHVQSAFVSVTEVSPTLIPTPSIAASPPPSPVSSSPVATPKPEQSP